MATLLNKIVKTVKKAVRTEILGQSIHNLKTSITTHGGVAHENRFTVSFSPPKQSLFNLDFRSIVTSALSGTFNAKNLINDYRDITVLITLKTLRLMLKYLS